MLDLPNNPFDGVMDGPHTPPPPGDWIRKREMERAREELLYVVEQKLDLLTAATEEKLEKKTEDDFITPLYVITLHLFLKTKEILDVIESESCVFRGIADTIEVIDRLLAFPQRIFEKASEPANGPFGKIKKRVSMKRFVRQTILHIARNLEYIFGLWEMSFSMITQFFPGKTTPQDFLYLRRTLKTLEKGKKIPMPTAQDLPFVFEYLENRKSGAEAPEESTSTPPTSPSEEEQVPPISLGEEY